MEDFANRIESEIPAEYHPLLKEYEKSMLNLMDAACEDDFVYGYQLGVRMLLAALTEESRNPGSP